MRRAFFFLLILSLALAASACTSAANTNSRTPTGAASPTAGTAGTGATAAPSQTPASGGSGGEAAAGQAPAATPQPTATAVGPLSTIPAPANPTAPEIASYQINVTLDPEQRTLAGEQVLTYKNTTQKPIPDLVFHLYINAFKSKETIFMKESGGQLRGFPFDEANAGWIDVTAVRLQGGEALKLETLEDGTLARAELPEPVAPGESVSVEMDFEVKLPRIFARTGWEIDQRGDPFFLVAQWFPKAGVWTEDGWRADPFHGNAEFFADFGNYDVSITLPADYVTGATGLPGEVTKSGQQQTVSYHAEDVIDFAWVASQHLKTAEQKVGGQELVYLYLPEHEWSIERTFDSAALAVERFSDWFGPYPYQRLTIVDVPESAGGAGGMEYPTFITVGATGGDRGGSSGWDDFLAVVTVHEVAHQWFQSMIATDEGREPWLDEGFAEYATSRLFLEEYGPQYANKARTAFPPGFLQGRRGAFLRNPDVPLYGTAWDMRYGDYVVAAYAKPGFALLTLENVLGEETMLAIMRTYYARYRFGHPTTEDFQRVAVEVSGQELDWFFEGLVYGEDLLNYMAKSMEGNTVEVSRGGKIELPVDVLVTLEGGAQETVVCQPVKDICTFRFDQPVQSVVVDPDRELLIDINWEDNQLPRR